MSLCEQHVFDLFKVSYPNTLLLTTSSFIVPFYSSLRKCPETRCTKFDSKIILNPSSPHTSDFGRRLNQDNTKLTYFYNRMLIESEPISVDSYIPSI